MCGRVWSHQQGCIVVDQQCRESNGKVKIEGYMRVSDEQAHQCDLSSVVSWRWDPIAGPYLWWHRLEKWE